MVVEDDNEGEDISGSDEETGGSVVASKGGKGGNELTPYDVEESGSE
jgi:hypothetical protein